ncbi:hypothetical protein OPQ81_000600 [Rhizoctonia solani]|nr:hypothetical protein OPQ81_000600 [Rhizoctonia solani]
MAVRMSVCSRLQSHFVCGNPRTERDTIHFRPPQNTMTTPHELALAQASLVREASLALPGEFTQCTYDLGYIKQAVYLCLTCEQGRGLCASCSIGCHADHEQIELFPKRHFRCDCPTSGMSRPCSLRPPTSTTHTSKLPINTENTYSQNFFRGGRFCRCAQTYDAKRERETMVQCLSCEDWFHESCLNLRERVPPRDLDAHPTAASQPEPEPSAQRAQNQNESTGTDESWALVRLPKTTLLRTGMMPSRPIRRQEQGTGAGTKRRASGTGVEDEQASKRPRAEESNPASNETKAPTAAEPSTSTQPITSPSTRCAAPPINTLAQTILTDPSAYGDVFLSAGWRERWCRCETCYPSLLSHTFLLEEEETYEPPQDPDAGLSLEELGMRALATLPHERALDSIRAYNAMRDDLMLYLRPFADSGREVREEDITAFFQRRRQGQGLTGPESCD